ncbi:unnamed protein product [Gordionus sp. m RMFG-2023]
MVLLSKFVIPTKNFYKNMHQRLMPLIPSEWPFKKGLDMMHFYACLTGIPLILFVAYCHIFIGPAELREIPEGYRPEEYEYFKHPVHRWFIKFTNTKQQRTHEMNLDYLTQQMDVQKWR